MALNISSSTCFTPQKPSLLPNGSKSKSKTHLKPTLNLNLKPQPLSLLFATYHQKPNPPKTHHHPIHSLFTGLVEELGQIRHLDLSGDGGFTLKIHATTVLHDVSLGDSIAVNGACLTVTHFDTKLAEFSVGLSPETLRRTSLSELEVGSAVNLERSVKPSTRMGGHFVQGHVDGTGEIVGLETE